MSDLKVIFRDDERSSLPLSSLWQKDLASDFPAVQLVPLDEERASPPFRLVLAEWASPGFRFYDFDARLDASGEEGPFTIVLAAAEEELPGFARQVLTRCQRLMNRRNAASQGAFFDRILTEHRAMHDLAKPLVRADYNHALDTWQWTLRLEPEAGLAVQVAALFHDIERLESEADVRIEQHAADYQTFKDAHAERGAALADAVLARAGVDAETRRRAGRLIAEHEQPQGFDAADCALLNDADALSFFSLNSPGYLDYYGEEQTRHKVAYTLRRLRPESRRHLAGLRLPSQVADLVAEELQVRERVA